MARPGSELNLQNRTQGYETDSSVSEGSNEWIKLNAEKIKLNADLRIAEAELKRIKDLPQPGAVFRNPTLEKTSELADLSSRLEAAKLQLAGILNLTTKAESDEKTKQEEYQAVLLQQAALKAKHQQKIQDNINIAASNKQKEQTYNALHATLQQINQQIAAQAIPQPSEIALMTKRCQVLQFYALQEQRAREERELYRNQRREPHHTGNPR